MKRLEVRETTRSLKPIARINLTPIRDSFYKDGGKWEPIKAIFNSLGITLSEGQEEYINSRFTFKAGEDPKRKAVVKADCGNYKEYFLFIMSNQLYIQPIVTAYVVIDLDEYERLENASLGLDLSMS